MANIMIVDDEKDVLFLLKVLIEKEKHTVIEASNGLEAYNKLTDNLNPVRPDVIVLDIMMPEMDGYTLQTKLQEIEEFRKIPLIILTAKGQIKDLFEMANNVYSFLEKPFDPQKLIETIKGALQWKQKQH